MDALLKEKYPHIKHGATIGHLYNPAIEIAKKGDHKEAKEYFEALTQYIYEENKDLLKLQAKGQHVMARQQAEKIVHSNIGYWSGYFESGTIEKVHAIFGSSHPIFGSTTPDMETAFNLGKTPSKK